VEHRNKANKEETQCAKTIHNIKTRVSKAALINKATDRIHIYKGKRRKPREEQAAPWSSESYESSALWKNREQIKENVS
jgi:hypothetical protein